MGQAEQNRLNKMPEQDGKERTVRTGVLGQGCQDRATRAGLTEQGRQHRTKRIGLL
jgi:hypothetical protein